MVGGGAGGTGGEVRPAQIVKHREQAGRHVADEHRDHERREAVGAAFEQDFDLGGGGFKPADAGADDDANFIAVEFIEFRAGILERGPAGVDAKLRVAVGAADFLGREMCIRDRLYSTTLVRRWN